MTLHCAPFSKPRNSSACHFPSKFFPPLVSYTSWSLIGIFFTMSSTHFHRACLTSIHLDDYLDHLLPFPRHFCPTRHVLLDLLLFLFLSLDLVLPQFFDPSFLSRPTFSLSLSLPSFLFSPSFLFRPFLFLPDPFLSRLVLPSSSFPRITLPSLSLSLVLFALVACCCCVGCRSCSDFSSCPASNSPFKLSEV